MIEIKHRFTGQVICAFDVATMREAATEAVKSRADLSGADLSRAYLSGADLSGADLSRAYLSGADLSGADLSRAYLSGADLSGAYLSRADLSGADLSGADLSRAYLSGADLSGAYLSRADLSGAYLSRADLSGAYLSGADLSGADLSRAYLSRAYLYRADLSGVDLSGADLSGALDIPALALAQNNICPEGTFIGWKKLSDGLIAKLQIVGDRVNSVGSRKCRASLVHVMAIYDGNNKFDGVAYDQYTGKLAYQAGEFVKPDSYDPGQFIECSHGIHFFLTRIEAENY